MLFKRQYPEVPRTSNRTQYTGCWMRWFIETVVLVPVPALELALVRVVN